jgi:hypothetical protein
VFFPQALGREGNAENVPSGTFPSGPFLDLYRARLTDVGLKELAKIKSLRSLNIRETKVTDAGAEEFLRALPNCDLER